MNPDFVIDHDGVLSRVATIANLRDPKKPPRCSKERSRGEILQRLQMSGRPAKLFVGGRLRRAREARRLTQAALARLIGMSPSYLNQIERDERPLPRRKIAALCSALGVNGSFFDDSNEGRASHDLREASADPVFGATPLSIDEAVAAVRYAPELGDRFLSLYRAFISTREEKTVTEAREGAHQALVGTGQSYDEVRDWVQAHRNHFDTIDQQGEVLAGRLDLDHAPDPFARLTKYLKETHGLTVETDPALIESGLFWRLQRGRRRIALTDHGRAESRSFWLAHIIGLLEQRRAIERLVRNASFTSEESSALARVGLANYYAGALLMPYQIFLHEARSSRYDIQRLQSRFSASFEQICHRLSTLQRPGLPGIPFFFFKTDIAGNILKRSSATRFQFARFGGPCPLWNVYAAFGRPGQISVGLARTPDDVTYLSIACTVGRSGAHYLARPRTVAVALGCEIEYAPMTVYATGIDLTQAEAAVPIGPGCRACERTDCRHRAVPPAGRPLDVGTAERGVVPYRIQ